MKPSMTVPSVWTASRIDMRSSAPSSNSEGTCGGSQAPSGCWAHVHMRVWAYPRLQAPRTPSGATLGQAKTCLRVQRSDAACQGGPQLVRVHSCAPRTQIMCALGRGGQPQDGTRAAPRLPSLVEPLPALLLWAVPGEPPSPLLASGHQDPLAPLP